MLNNLAFFPPVPAKTGYSEELTKKLIWPIHKNAKCYSMTTRYKQYVTYNMILIT